MEGVPRDAWEITNVAQIMRSDARLTWSLRQALVTMEKADIDRLPVVQDDWGFVGIVSTADLFKLDEILEQTGDTGDA
jgi:CBS-domain-containing membrane protein